ncbi:MAG: iron ABC transporter permease [Prevotellaceae bacterium]|jgi:iron complex transport system permease protein|nr:iron ABC transporter permease [Prevotellaceae bacterium]
MSRATILIIFFSLLFVAAFVADLMFGSIHISFNEIVAVFREGRAGTNEINYEILLNFRLPKTLTAVLTGASLSIAGLMMQTLFRNPLADPYILGVSSGAGLGVALAVMLSASLPTVLVGGGWSLVLSATIGALAVLLLVVAVSFKVRDVISLLIIGIMFGAICSSVVTVLQNFSNPDTIKLFVMWTFGSLSAVTWEYMKILLPVILFGWLMAFLLQKRLDALLLGENYARALGVPIQQTRFFIVAVTGLLAGAVTAFTGPIAFVGVVIPHIARGLFRSSSHRVLLPACILAGALLLLLCDIITQIPAYTLPVNTVSALFGAPIIIWILIRGKR